MFTMIDNLWISSVVVLVILGFLYWIFVHPFKEIAAAGIPGPKPWPVIGNVMDFLGEKEANEVERGYVEKYGKVCGYYAGRDPMVLVADPTILHQIMQKDFSKFPNRPAAEVKLLYGPGQRSVLHIKDDDWRRIRQIISPVFSAAKLKQMVPVMKESMDTLMTVFEKNADGKKSCDVSDIFCLYTMETMLSLAFGIKNDTQKDPKNPYSESARAFFEFDFLFILTKIIPFYGKILHWTRLLFGAIPCIKFLAAAATRIIHARRQTGGLSKRKDLLDLLLNAQYQNEDGSIDRLTDDEIIGQSITFMLAGHETTANSLSLTAYNLAMHPEIQERLIEEIKEKIGEDEEIDYINIQKLTYLEMVFAENMRLFSPAFRYDRTCKESCTINGVKFEAGFSIGIAVSHLHMNPEYWPEPEKFDPERFSPEAKAARDPFCYLPFGAGPRHCVGSRFTYFQAKMVLTSILRKFKFALAPDTEIPAKRRVATLGLQPINGVWLLIQTQ